MTDFILAAALICASANEVRVTHVITNDPITHVQCEKMTKDEKYRKEYVRPSDGKCEVDLICVHVRWKD